MRTHGLGPHTFISPQPHPRHHEWLTHFSPRERHRLIQEDCSARWQLVGIMVGVILAGMCLLVATLLIAI
jgi:hypothetical protein